MAKLRNTADDLGLRPLTARSVMLSVLLGTHPPKLPVRTLVRVGQLFDIPEGTVRVALSRMAADGEISADNGTYRLTGRLLGRAARQDESRTPTTRRWTGDWDMAVVTATGRPASERTALRRAMLELHLAQAREGVWLRPANLVHAQPLPRLVQNQCLWFESRPSDDPVALARSLWDLEGWAAQANRLLKALDHADGLAKGFMVSAAVLRHLLADPILPAELLPDDWPGPELRRRYEVFDAGYRADLRDYALNGAEEPAG
jgi:phenylacetic acid degradation operon negative regulatory protein